MGLWGKLSTLWSGHPKPPAQRPYSPDAYFGWTPAAGKAGQQGKGAYQGPGSQETLGASRMAYNELEKLGQRPYGFSDEEMRSIYMPAAEQRNLGTQAEMRGVNRAANQAGGFGSGGRTRQIGSAIEKGERDKSNLKWQTQALQAKTALDDRYRRIAAFDSFAQPRLGMMGNEQGRRLGYMSGQNKQDFAGYQQQLNQYNQDFAFAWDLLQRGSQGIT